MSKAKVCNLIHIQFQTIFCCRRFYHWKIMGCFHVVPSTRCVKHFKGHSGSVIGFTIGLAIRQKILSCFHLNHFEIVPTVPKSPVQSSSKPFLVITFLGILWGCWLFYHWIGQKILRCLYVKHFQC